MAINGLIIHLFAGGGAAGRGGGAGVLPTGGPRLPLPPQGPPTGGLAKGTQGVPQCVSTGSGGFFGSGEFLGSGGFLEVGKKRGSGDKLLIDNIAF